MATRERFVVVAKNGRRWSYSTKPRETVMAIDLNAKIANSSSNRSITGAIGKRLSVE
jgi:hypothetical protein